VHFLKKVRKNQVAEKVRKNQVVEKKRLAAASTLAATAHRLRRTLRHLHLTRHLA